MPKILISKAFSFYIKFCFVIDKWHNISENVFSLNFVSVLALGALQDKVADSLVLYDLRVVPKKRVLFRLDGFVSVERETLGFSDKFIVWNNVCYYCREFFCNPNSRNTND